MFNRARPIESVLRDEKTSPRLKGLLGEVSAIKKFGENFGLRPTPNYKEYVALNRPVATWVVSACNPLKFEPKEWSFPIVGGFPYLGWFDLEDAKGHAQKLKNEGWDVDLRGASAYSTLGWFKDPVLSSMISEGPTAFGDLTNVILHESVHATIYVKGQGFFNESVATYIADGLTRQYLQEKFGSGHAGKEADAPEVREYLAAELKAEARQKRLFEVYQELEKLYSRDDVSSEQKLQKKAEILIQVKSELGFKRDINNAVLVQYKAYHAPPKGYDELLSQCKRDWPRFVRALQTLKPSDFSKAQDEDLEPVLKKLSSQCEI